MIIDAQHLFSSAQALAATALSTNVIDLTVDRSIGVGEPMVVCFHVTSAATVNDTDETYQFDVETASDAGITTARKLMGRRLYQATPTPPAEAASLLAAGFRFSIPLPKTLLSESEIFLGVRYTLGGTTPAITVTSFLAPMSFAEYWNAFADAVTFTG